MGEQVVIGVDGGGTSTRVALADGSGQILGIGMSGSGNYHDVGLEQVKLHISAALEEAWDQAARPKQDAAAAFLALGSVASHADREAIRALARDLHLAPTARIQVDHDLSAALAGGLAGRPGIVLIVGTGSASFGRAPDGNTWRAGGWGPTLDDVGSSGWLGLQAMIATVKQFDGRGEPTVLSERVFEALSLKDIQEILWKVDGEKMSRRDMAALAVHVTAAAAQGDQVALEILSRGAEELAFLPATVAARLNLTEVLDPIPVTIAGGLTQAGAVFTETLHRAIESRLPQAEIVEPICQPVFGSVLRALEILHGGLPEQVLENLLHSQTAAV